jgi:hypothetical protein
MSIQPFFIHVPEIAIENLKERLSKARFPDEITNSGWKFGADLNYMKVLLDYWHHDFNWRIEEAKVNEYPNFIANIDGFIIHFIHVKGKGSSGSAVIITHGWPGSFLEMMKIIPMLTDPVSYGGKEGDGL